MRGAQVVGNAEPLDAQNTFTATVPNGEAASKPSSQRTMRFNPAVSSTAPRMGSSAKAHR